MVRVERDWRDELVLAYPDLFHPAGDPPAVQAVPDVGDGWRDLLERACARIPVATQADGGTFKATQIREKFGTLRFDRDGRLSPVAWIYGHTHESEDIVIGATRVVSNAKGYGPWLPQQRAWDNQSFDPNLVIEI